MDRWDGPATARYRTPPDPAESSAGRDSIAWRAGYDPPRSVPIFIGRTRVRNAAGRRVGLVECTVLSLWLEAMAVRNWLLRVGSAQPRLWSGVNLPLEIHRIWRIANQLACRLKTQCEVPSRLGELYGAISRNRLSSGICHVKSLAFYRTLEGRFSWRAYRSLFWWV